MPINLVVVKQLEAACWWRILKLCCAGCFVLAPDAVSSYPIDATTPATTSAPTSCTRESTEQLGGQLKAQFGHPAHEKLTQRTVEWVKAGKTKTEVNQRVLHELLARPKDAKLTILACCRYTQGSHFCQCLNDAVRTAQFKDADPLSTGARWPDDPCHMLARSETHFIPMHWFLGRSTWGNNLFYLSHFHNFAFLHSMASSGDKDANSVELTIVTRRRILTWLEFAFRVAQGDIPTAASFRDARDRLTDVNRPEFGRMFPGFIGQPKSWTVDMFFVGIQGADAHHVRQVALGALLHTVQDAFSDAHVLREGRPELGRAQPVTGVGGVVRFLDYKTQNKLGKHAAGDAPPADLYEPSDDAAAIHPVRVGAEVIACMAPKERRPSSQDAWACAEPVLEQPFRLSGSSKRGTGPGQYR